MDRRHFLQCLLGAPAALSMPSAAPQEVEWVGITHAAVLNERWTTIIPSSGEFGSYENIRFYGYPEGINVTG